MAASVGFKSAPMTMVFTCEDFAGTCCQCCHEQGDIIVLYPWSVYSTKDGKMPDMSLGIRAEVCCGRFDSARAVPREKWLRSYAAKEGWSEKDTERFVKAGPKDYYRIWGEIKGGGPTPSVPRVAKPAQRTKPAGGKCPSCGSKWDGFACDNCGHSS